jgi:hypothetical protein
MRARTPPDTPVNIAQAVQQKGGGSAMPANEPPLQPDRALVPTKPELDDGAVLLEGELACARLKKSPAMADWLAVGKALLVLRKQATQEVGAYKGKSQCPPRRSPARLLPRGSKEPLKTGERA